MAKILIIEDNEQNLYLETFILEKSGHEILQANNGEAGIALAAQALPDLILLDLSMPTMSGSAVLRKLRDMGADCPVVMITACADPVQLQERKDLGAVNIVAKPFSLSTISIEVRRQLNSSLAPAN